MNQNKFRTRLRGPPLLGASDIRSERISEISLSRLSFSECSSIVILCPSVSFIL